MGRQPAASSCITALWPSIAGQGTEGRAGRRTTSLASASSQQPEPEPKPEAPPFFSCFLCPSLHSAPQHHQLPLSLRRENSDRTHGQVANQQTGSCTLGSISVTSGPQVPDSPGGPTSTSEYQQHHRPPDARVNHSSIHTQQPPPRRFECPAANSPSCKSPASTCG